VLGKDLKLLVTVLRTEGPVELLRRVAFRFLHVHTFTVFRMDLTDAMPRGQIPAGIDFKEVTREQLKELRTDRTDLPEYFYRDESEALDRCWVGLQGGRLEYITWLSRHNSSGMVRVGNGEAELNYFYCCEPLRGKRMTTNAVLVIARTLFEEGIASIYTVVHSGNPAMVKSVVACGFAPVGSIRRFGFLTWPRTPVDYSRSGGPGAKGI